MNRSWKRILAAFALAAPLALPASALAQSGTPPSGDTMKDRGDVNKPTDTDETLPQKKMPDPTDDTAKPPDTNKAEPKPDTDKSKKSDPLDRSDTVPQSGKMAPDNPAPDVKTPDSTDVPRPNEGGGDKGLND